MAFPCEPPISTYANSKCYQIRCHTTQIELLRSIPDTPSLCIQSENRMRSETKRLVEEGLYPLTRQRIVCGRLSNIRGGRPACDDQWSWTCTRTVAAHTETKLGVDANDLHDIFEPFSINVAIHPKLFGILTRQLERMKIAQHSHPMVGKNLERPVPLLDLVTDYTAHLLLNGLAGSVL
jgi:hypothetical protein